MSDSQEIHDHSKDVDPANKRKLEDAGLAWANLGADDYLWEKTLPDGDLLYVGWYDGPNGQFKLDGDPNDGNWHVIRETLGQSSTTVSGMNLDEAIAFLAEIQKPEWENDGHEFFDDVASYRNAIEAAMPRP